MSYLDLDLQINIRNILVIHTHKDDSTIFFEDLAQEAQSRTEQNLKEKFQSTLLCKNQDLNQNLEHFLAFSIGKRRNIEERFFLLGVLHSNPSDLEKIPWDSFDAILFNYQSKKTNDFFTIKFPTSIQSTPVVCIGPWSQPDNEEIDLKAKAFKKWIERNFSKRYFSSYEEKFFQGPAEWIMLNNS